VRSLVALPGPSTPTRKGGLSGRRRRDTGTTCHGLGDNSMNGISAADYGYALESNDNLQKLISRGESLLVIKWHRHHPAVRGIGQLTLLDAGSLLDHSERGRHTQFHHPDGDDARGA
jgi:hypothetical protein